MLNLAVELLSSKNFVGMLCFTRNVHQVEFLPRRLSIEWKQLLLHNCLKSCILLVVSLYKLHMFSP
ncbi:hypothetical protein L9F63_020210, partial [Diploptera punctata]